MKSSRLWPFALAVSLSPVAWGQSTSPIRTVPTSVNPSGSGETVSSIPSAGIVTRTGSETISVRIINSCYGTNLRGVSNPVSPNGTITANIVLEAAGEQIPIRVDYPGHLVAAGGMVLANGQAPNPLDPSQYSIPGSGGRAGIYGNTVMVDVPVTFQASVDTTGKIVKTSEKVFIRSSSFSQTMNDCSGGAAYGHIGWSTWMPAYPCGAYMGRTGGLTASVGSPVVSADNTSVQISVAFPGQTGFCGGYFSPLMVFFDEQRPGFTNISEFPLNPIGKTTWPEAHAPGYFIAIDRDQSKKIDQKLELFGDSDQHKNGFEALREFDSNKDGWIDQKDKQFKKLVLWNDKNGDGISQADEVVSLESKLSRVSLAYEKDRLRPIGKHAEEREKSFAIVKGSKKKVQVVDMWFEPRFEQRSTLSENRRPASIGQ